LREGLGQSADAVLRAALSDLIGPELAFEDDQTVATFGSTRWVKDVALRELRCGSTSKA
jgi:hypothetical protein